MLKEYQVIKVTQKGETIEDTYKSKDSARRGIESMADYDEYYYIRTIYRKKQGWEEG